MEKDTKKRYTSISIDVRLKDKLDEVMFRQKKRKSYNELINDLANKWLDDEQTTPEEI
jgi:hypothetical protein